MDENNKDHTKQETEEVKEASVISKSDENGVRQYTIPPQKSKGYKKPLIIFASILVGIILLGVACSNIGITTVDSTGIISSDGKDYADTKEDHITVIHVEGEIADTEASSEVGDTYNHQWTLDRISEAKDNINNKGLIIFVNTPGGGVYESDELYVKLKEYKEETGRPVYSAMGSMAASGGYYISAPADKIIANRNCWTGSIGVTIGSIMDISELLDRYGIKTVTITSGKNKAMGSSVEPLTKQQKEIFQGLVDESYDQFVEVVKDGRKMKDSKVRKLADGRIYTAKQAKANGLIDQIGTLEEAQKDMQKTYKLENCQVVDLKYESNSFFGNLLGKIKGTKNQFSGDASALLELMNDQGKFPITYMTDVRK
ncbi:MAG: signal peptide peptidase SppA [Anaerovoracaceae bacterium]